MAGHDDAETSAPCAALGAAGGEPAAGKALLPFELLAGVLLVVMLLVSVPPAEAARRSLIKLGGLQQNVDLEYQYQQQASESDGSQEVSSSSHRLDERYTGSFLYAIVSPNIIKGRFSASAEFNQEESESTDRQASSASGNRFAYNLTGKVLQKSWYPATFFNYLQYSRVQQAFSPGYDLRSDGVGGTFSLRTRIPTLFSYSRRTLQTTGAVSNTETTTDSYLLSTSHNYREISQTSLSLSYGRSDTTAAGQQPVSSSEVKTGQLKNLLNFSRDTLNRSVSSTLQYQQESGTFDNRSLELNETVDWDLGKALQSNLIYLHRDRSIGGKEVVENSGTGWLQHRLFESLTTRLEGRGRQTDYAFGSIRESGGGINLDYQKLLSAENLLTLGFGYDYSLFDNALGEDILSVANEQQTVGDLPPYELILGQPDVVVSSIVVRSMDRTFTYTEGVDYTVTVDGRETRIVLPQIPTAGPVPIVSGSILSIDYQYRVNPSVKYSLTRFSGRATLSLQQNRYRFYLRVSDSSQNLLESRQTTGGLVDVQSIAAGFEARREYVSYGVSYQRTDSTLNSGESYEGFWRYGRNFGREDLRVTLRERYSLFSNGGQGSGNYTNTLSAIVDYNRTLLSWAALRLQGRYQMLRGRSPSDEVGATMDLTAHYGRMEAALGSEMVWRFSPGVTSSDTLIKMRISRYF